YLDSLPTLPNGKLNRKVLPTLTRVEPERQDPYVAPTSSLESQLAVLWSEVLHLDRVGIQDHFFEIGGNSLLAVRTVVRTRAALQIDLSAAALYHAPTVAELAAYIVGNGQREPKARSSDLETVQQIVASLSGQATNHGASLVQLQNGSANPPLFCIHGLGGHVAAFMPLARQLGDSWPVYGLQAQGLDAGQQPHDRIEDMAEFYLSEIRRVRPEGPYLLAGWSMGGLIATEAARRLVAAGEEVALLAMLDTYLSVTDRLAEEVDEASGIRWIAPRLKIPLREIQKLPLEKQWEVIAERADLAEGIGAAEIRRLAQVCQSHLTALARYTPKPYDGDAVLFRAKGNRDDKDLRWNGIYPQLRVERVPGGHYGMLRDPAVAKLAQRLGHYLQNVLSAP
ncbi:MAG: alpha/beta fold hydrolase, partial [Pirellulaceae bacterium]